MCMNLEEALSMAQMSDRKSGVAKRLANECGFFVGPAIAWAHSEGRCEYCRRDLIVDRFGYACGDREHVLPDREVRNHPLNWALACSLCNSIKRDHSVLLNGEDAVQSLEDEDIRETLIGRVREYILNRRRDVYDPVWENAKRILFPELPRQRERNRYGASLQGPTYGNPA